MLIIKILIIAVLCSIIAVSVKQIRPEFLPFVQVASVLLLLTISLSSVRAMIDKLNLIMQSGDSFIVESAFTLFKVLAVAVATKLASNLCNDNGNSSLSVCVELVGKIIVILMCFPLVETIFELSLRFI